MSAFPRNEPEAPAKDLPADGLPEDLAEDLTKEPIAGDRGIPLINRSRSLQSRVSSILAICLMSTLGVGLLTWYYAKALNRPAQAQHAAQTAAKNRAQGEMPLPPLGPIESPLAHRPIVEPVVVASEPPAAERMLGPAPALPPAVVIPAAMPTQAMPDPGAQKSPGELAFERRLAGPAFARNAGQGGSVSAVSSSQNPDPNSLAGTHGRAEADGGDPMNTLLRPTLTPAVDASMLPTRRFLLSKGAFIDCTLETAIDSSLPGMTTCVTATDTFSADGSIVLLERGTKLVGETRGEVAQGTSRLFVLWTEARTPTGVVVPLASPGTDVLGRSGLAGEVNRHFWDRFGAAILLTVINGAVQGAVQSQSSGSSVIVSPTSTSDVMTEVLKSTINIPPTVTKSQGDRIQVFVARDVDFRPVYALRRVQASAVPKVASP